MILVMSIPMKEIDSLIDTTINRLSGESGTMHSTFYIDLRSYQTRITKRLVEDAMKVCQSRGLYAEQVEGGLKVDVDLSTCFMNPQQTTLFNAALNFTRAVHGNHF